MSTKNIKHTELIAKLREDSKNKTKSEVAQQAQQEQKTTTNQAVKVRNVKNFILRNVKDFILVRTKAEFDKDTRKTKDRAYMTEQLAENSFQTYNATCYRNDKNELVLFSQALANKYVNEYVAKLASMSKFDAQNIMTLLKTCGGAYGDKVRNALFSISLRTTAQDIEKDVNAVIATAQEKKKLCIFYNVIEDSRRAKYDFIKI